VCAVDKPLSGSLVVEKVRHAFSFRLGRLFGPNVNGSHHAALTFPFLDSHFAIPLQSDAVVKSIEVQLVRVETCGCADGYAKEATEIQNIQVSSSYRCIFAVVWLTVIPPWRLVRARDFHLPSPMTWPGQATPPHAASVSFTHVACGRWM
jgi:hypothetical protein